MNNEQHKKEYSEEDIQKLLKKESDAIMPSESLLMSILEKLPARKIPSPYGSTMKEFAFSFKRISFALVALVVVVIGTTTYVHYKLSVPQSSLATTNIDNQIAAIDNQMNGLTMDTSVADQALDHQPASHF